MRGPVAATTENKRCGWKTAAIALFLFLGAEALYVLTISPGGFPGLSASIVASQAGIHPFPSLSHPIWAALCSLASRLPFGGIAVRLNVASAGLGALCVALTYLSMCHVGRTRAHEEIRWRSDRVAVRQISAVAAALILAVSLPFWIVSNRAHYASLDTAILLLSVLCLQQTGAGRRLPWLGLASLLWGLGVTESATFLFLGPVFAAGVFVVLWQSGRASLRAVLSLAACGLAGLAPFFFHVWVYSKSPAFEWREFENYGQALYYAALDHWINLRYGFPKYGWIPLAITTVVPWYLCMGYRLPRRPDSGPQIVFGSYLLRAVFTVLAALLLLNFPISPWALTHGFSPLLVTPYVFIALWTGYLVGYWHAALWHEPHPGPRRTPVLRRAGRLLYYPVLVGFLAVVVVRNFPEADGRRAALADRYAREVVDSLGGRTWLLSNGVLDDLIRLEAHDRGIPLKIINTDATTSKAYLRYVASLVDTPRLKSLAMTGFGPLVTELLRTDPKWIDGVANLVNPDFFFAGGREPVPQCVLYIAASTNTPPDLKALRAAHTAFWDEVTPLLQRLRRPRDTKVDDLHGWLRSLIGKSANNLGVFLEDRGEYALGYDAYVRARAMDPNNVSALLNQAAAAHRDQRPEAAALEKEAADTAKKVSSRRVLWALSMHCGYIRHPDVYASRGWAWAMSGQQAQAQQDMQKAIEMAHPGVRGELAMAQLFMMENMDQRSEQAFLDVLRKDPRNVSALFALAQIATQQGNAAGARNYLQRLEELSASPTRVAKARIAVLMKEQRWGEARAQLEQIVRDHPDDAISLTLLAAMAANDGDDKAMRSYIEKVCALPKIPPDSHLLIARMELTEDRLVEARFHLSETLRLQPDNPVALELMLHLDVRQNRREDAQRHVQSLLRLNPSHPFANYVLGTLHTAERDFTLAEAAFRASLAARRDGRVLNDLAWVVAKQGRIAEAEPFAVEAVKLVEDNPAAWDTLANIQLQLGRVDDAEKSIQKALSLAPQAPSLLLSMVRLYEKKKMDAEALTAGEQLLQRGTELSDPDREELQQIVKRLGGKTAAAAPGKSP
jgi:tetratricopeptide (TPR) repeat protein